MHTVIIVGWLLIFALFVAAAWQLFRGSRKERRSPSPSDAELEEQRERTDEERLLPH